MDASLWRNVPCHSLSSRFWSSASRMLSEPEPWMAAFWFGQSEIFLLRRKIGTNIRDWAPILEHQCEQNAQEQASPQFHLAG